MPNSYFRFKHFTIHQDRSAMKVTTDACLFGAWAAERAQREQPGQKNVLDVGTGTGLLSIMYAQKNTISTIDAIEIDKNAYEQARENVAASPFAQQINVLPGDVKTAGFDKKYDVIISNPPFYENELISTDEKKNFAHHYSGLLLHELLEIIKANLSPTGTFYLLLPFKRQEEIRDLLFKQSLFATTMIFAKQSSSHNYFRIMISGKLERTTEAQTIIDEISIWNEHQQYTTEFTELLKDYYLKL